MMSIVAVSNDEFFVKINGCIWHIHVYSHDYVLAYLYGVLNNMQKGGDFHNLIKYIEDCVEIPALDRHKSMLQWKRDQHHVPAVKQAYKLLMEKK